LRRLRELDGPDESLFFQERAESMFQDMDQQEAACNREKFLAAMAKVPGVPPESGDEL